MDKLAILTIGQSPRIDAVSDIETVLGNGVHVVEYGALDRFSEEEAIEKLKPSDNERVLVSRLRSGREIKMSEEKVHKLVEETINIIERDGIDKTLLFCTGKFPQYKYKGLLIVPYELIHGITKILAKEEKVGIIIPNEDQVESSIRFWAESGVKVVVKTVSPYTEGIEEFSKKAKDFKDEDVSFIVLDCMGYSMEMKKMVLEKSKKPVLLSRSFVGSVVKELF